jgi:ZIP family zinc transporter
MTDLQMTILGMSLIGLMTVAGSAMVYFFKKTFSEKFNKIFLGFAAGVMIAASIWSLLIPAIEQSDEQGLAGWIPATVGFAAGGLVLLAIDKLVPHFHIEGRVEEGLPSKLKMSSKLFLAMTIHNIPEGLAVGFAFGAAWLSGERAMFLGALGLAIGIALQNFPEGAAVTLPLKKEYGNANKAFGFGLISAVVEPIAAVLGLLLALFGAGALMMPWLLAFAAGMMVYVTIEELIPEAHLGEHSDFGTWGVMIGFLVMMILDVALG